MSSFYYDFILSERSTLAKVWLAAHWEKKLSKVQVFETNLISSVHDILHPITPIALRTSSHLLVGLARIYSRKAKYLLTDCSEALVNIKVTFRPGAQIFEEQKKKKRSQVDCPLFITEKVDLLDQWVPEASNAEMDCSLNQSKIEEITIQEEPMKVSSLEDYFDDEGFGDMFDPELTEQELEKGESSFLRVHSFADSDCVLEDSFSHSSSITDFGDPFLSLSPVKEADEINKLKNRTLETRSEIDLPKCVSELDEEMPKVRNFCPKVDHMKLRIEITNNHGVEQAKIVLDPIVEPSVKPSRKSLKRKLLVDSEISIDREEYFYQIRNASRLCGMPVIAPRTKCHMKQIRKNAQSLFLSHQEFLAPCLQKLFESPKVKNNSMSSSHVEEEIAFSHIHENGEGHIDSVFIPVQDVEYSDNEDDVNIFHNEDPKSFPDETNSASSVEEDASTEQDEDITHDEFCAFVEASVLKSHPEPINIQQVIFQGSPTRKNVARRFTKCLIMQRDGRLRLDQASHFSGIYLYPGDNHVSLLVCS